VQNTVDKFQDNFLELKTIMQKYKPFKYVTNGIEESPKDRQRLLLLIYKGLDLIDNK
jgi:hypothetical protein